MITLKTVGYYNDAGSDQALSASARYPRQCGGQSPGMPGHQRAAYRGNPVLTDTSYAGNYGEQLTRAMLDKVKI